MSKLLAMSLRKEIIISAGNDQKDSKPQNIQANALIE
jgi:hypothetical protein